VEAILLSNYNLVLFNFGYDVEIGIHDELIIDMGKQRLKPL